MKRTLLTAAALLALSPLAQAAPFYADSLVASSNVTSFGSGSVLGAADGGGLFLSNTFDPPTLLGSITVGFSTALGNGAGNDLEIFDVVNSANETFNVEVSTDGVAFTNLGEFSATNNLVDFGAFAEPVSFVRLTSTARENSTDIDAFRGFYAAAPVPEPTTMGLLAVGLAGLAVAARRRRSAA